jgi:hypothetical protein
VKQIENRVSEMEGIVKDHERMLRKYEWNMQDIWEIKKRQNLSVMGVEEGEEIHIKG